MSILAGSGTTSVTYAVSINDIKQLIANDLGIPVDKLDFNFVLTDASDPGDRWSRYEFGHVKVGYQK